jgi:hypothetical protein
MKKHIYYCDMDGVLADFFNVPNCVERFKTEKHFFKKLEQIKENIQAIKTLIKQGKKVKIISTSPHKQADLDKMKWLSRNLPEVKKRDIIFTRPEKDKIDYLSERVRKNAILFDDYGKNNTHWVLKGGFKAYKIIGNKEKKKHPVYTEVKNIFECGLI